MNPLFSWLVGVGLLTVLALPAWTQDEPVQLSPKQGRVLRGIRERYDGRRQDLQLKLQGRRLELARLLREDATEKATLQAKLDEILDLERQRQQLFLDEIFEARGQLTPAQWGPFRRRVLRHLLQDGGQRRLRGRQSPRPGSGPSSP